MSDDRSDETTSTATVWVPPRRPRPKPLRVPIDHVARVSIVDGLPLGADAGTPLPASAPSSPAEAPEEELHELEPEFAEEEPELHPPEPEITEAPVALPEPVAPEARGAEEASPPAPSEPVEHDVPELDADAAGLVEAASEPPEASPVLAAAVAAGTPEPAEAPLEPETRRTEEDSTEITLGPPSGEFPAEPTAEAPKEAAGEHDEDIELEEVSEQELALHAKPKAPIAPEAPKAARSAAEAPKAVPPAPPEAPKPPPAPPEAAKAPPAPPRGAPPAPPAEAAKPSAPRPPAEIPLPKKRQKPWYEDFFSDDYLRTVRHPTEREIAKECDFIEKVLGLPAGATILDVGCGLGLYAIELTKRGYLVVGLDLSLPMLSRASEDAKDQGLRINFLHGDMREMSFDGSFDVVLSWGTAFGYFDDEGNRKVLQRFYNSLKPGGMLLLDVANRDFVIRTQPNLVWFEGDGCICMEETKFNYLNSRLEVSRNVILDDGKQRDRSYSIRLYALHELGQMLHQQRFRVSLVSGNRATPGVFFGADSPRLIVLAERKREDDPRSSPPPPPPSEGANVSSSSAAPAPSQPSPGAGPASGTEGGAGEGGGA